jgi:hypothetical protein
MASLLGDVLIWQRIYQQFVDITRKLSRSTDLARLGLAAVVVLELENQIVRLEECDKPVDQWVVC